MKDLGWYFQIVSSPAGMRNNLARTSSARCGGTRPRPGEAVALQQRYLGARRKPTMAHAHWLEARLGQEPRCGNHRRLNEERTKS